MRITRAAIVTAALRQLDHVGLDGLTVRRIAADLGVQAPALYWHVKNKEELLTAMAEAMITEAFRDVEAPRRTTSWTDWLGDIARALRAELGRHRDGALIFAATNVADPRLSELILGTLVDAGFSLGEAARSAPVVLHYTVGFAIDEQTATPVSVDPERFPLLVQALPEQADARFEHGLGIILTGLRVARFGR